MTPDILVRREEIVQIRLKHAEEVLTGQKHIGLYFREKYGDFADIAFLLDRRSKNKKTFKDTPQKDYAAALGRIFEVRETQLLQSSRGTSGESWWAAFDLRKQYPDVLGGQK